mgnify:CR=1 FL=1|tara:strand:- start:3338 stop:3955 length:618 start_codon:yes stop_codon:yes gene_type:complete
MWWDIIKSDDLHKDFKFRQGKSWITRFREWVLTRLNRVTGLKLDKEDVLRFPGLYDPKTKEATVFLDGIENIRRMNLKYTGETGGTYTQSGDDDTINSYTEVLTEMLVHEYIHKILMEDPQIMEELKPYKKHIFDRHSVSAQEWATALMSTTDELRGLAYLASHQDVDPSVKQKAIQKIQEIENKKQQVAAEVKTFLQENPVEEV